MKRVWLKKDEYNNGSVSMENKPVCLSEVHRTRVSISFEKLYHL